MVRTDVIHDSARLFDLRDQWSELLGCSATGTVFQSPGWVEAWWHRFGTGKQLFAVAVRQGEMLVGLALFMLMFERRYGFKVRSLHFIGQTGSGICPDHLDVLARPGFEEITQREVVASLFEGAQEWDVMELSSLAESSSFFGLFLQEAGKRNYRSTSGQAYVAPFLELPSRLHKNWKDKYRKLCKSHTVSLEYLSAVGEVERGLAVTRSLVSDSARRNHRETSWDDASYAGFHSDVCHKLAQKNEFQVTLLACDGEPAAVLYGYIFKNKYLMYSTGINAVYGNYSVGQILVGSYLDYLAASGIDEFDFLRGSEEYKFRWTNTVRRNLCVTVYGKGFAGRYLQALEFLKDICRGIRARLRRVTVHKEAPR